VQPKVEKSITRRRVYGRLVCVNGEVKCESLVLVMLLSKLKKGRYFPATEQPFFFYRREAHLLKTGFFRPRKGS